MAQNITLMGASYSAVPSVNLPKTGGGTASFTDVTDTTATASDVASGKYFYTASGVRTQGTSSGGGGSSNWTLIGSTTLTVNTTSTSAASAGTVSCGSSAWTSTDIIWVRIRGQSGKRNGYFYGSDTIFANYRPMNGSTTAMSSPAVQYYRVGTDGLYFAATGSYGVYGYSVSSNGTVTIRRRYNSSNTLTINDKFDVEVYKLTLPTGKSLFT